MSEKTIGIIGFGDFGRLMVKELSPYFNIVVSSRHAPEDAEQYPCTFVDVPKSLSQEIIIPSIPAQNLEEFFTDNKKYVNPQSLVVDVCSVKVNPVATLLKVLPDSVEILATHPMFGPASAANGLKGNKIMVDPTRLNPEKYRSIKTFFIETLELKIIECTPEEHDRTMAYVQGLSHYIGRTMQILDIPETELATAAYEDLYDMKCIQGNDSWELFHSIMYENPYAMEIHAKFKEAMWVLDEKLKKT